VVKSVGRSGTRRSTRSRASSRVVCGATSAAQQYKRGTSTQPYHDHAGDWGSSGDRQKTAGMPQLTGAQYSLRWLQADVMGVEGARWDGVGPSPGVLVPRWASWTLPHTRIRPAGTATAALPSPHTPHVAHGDDAFAAELGRLGNRTRCLRRTAWQSPPCDELTQARRASGASHLRPKPHGNTHIHQINHRESKMAGAPATCDALQPQTGNWHEPRCRRWRRAARHAPARTALPPQPT
jgi:hypothetical protein